MWAARAGRLLGGAAEGSAAGIGRRRPLQRRWMAATPAVAAPVEEVAAEGGEKKPRRVRKDPIVLTDNAVVRIKTLLQGKNHLGVLLGVRRRGCNGLSYTLNYTDKIEKFADIVEKDGVKVVIDPKALMHLIGTTMDYQEDEISAEFKFINPNAKGSCGCGESFST